MKGTTRTAAIRGRGSIHGKEALRRAAGAGLGILLASASPTLADDGQIPPTEITYRCEVFDSETGLPLADIRLTARERIDRYFCYELSPEGLCTNCNRNCETQEREGWTDGAGRLEVDFPLPYCRQVDDAPPTWEKVIHLGWEAPAISEEFSGDGSDRWIVGRVDPGGGAVDHRVHLVRESYLAERFAPVLHGHRGRELQDGLADLIRSIEDHSRVSAYDVLGRRLEDVDPPPLHIHHHDAYDSYGQGFSPVFWLLDFDDSVLHQAAPSGERPLYFHVFPHGSGAVIQYWLWLQGNDLRNLPGPDIYHEGDWEYLSLYVELVDGEWIAKGLNLSQHVGGQSLLPSEVWWSPTNEPTYDGLTAGFTPDRTHPHVWVAANSHALYTRFGAQYGVDVDVPPICDIHYGDRVDFNPGDIIDGDHRFFAYDRLEEMGEFSQVGAAHGEDYLWHWTGGPLEPLQFVGRFGESECISLSDCLSSCDLGVFAYMSRSPRSPLDPEPPHLWRSFRHELGRWGNEDQPPAEISWRDIPPLGNYLGEVSGCADGRGDTLRTWIPATLGDVPARARFSPVSGDPELLETDANGDLELGPPGSGGYLLETARITGSGEGRLDVSTWDGVPLATDLRFHVVPGECGGTSGTESARGSGAPSGPRVVGSPSRTGFSLELGSSSEIFTGWMLYDVRGRRVAEGSIPAERSHFDWSGGPEGPLAPGRYFLALTGPGGQRPIGPIVILR